MNARVALVVVCGSLVLAAHATAEEFERRIPVARGTRLDVRLHGGEVAVHGWNRDAVRVRATHFSTDSLEAGLVDGIVTVRARLGIGRPHAIDVSIDVPTWMAVTVAGLYVDISVTGTRSDITAETVRGDVRVRGGRGNITLKSIAGDVSLEGAQGRAEVHAANNGVRVTALKGDLRAETVNGNVILKGLQSTSVDVATIGGDIDWEGDIADHGQYRLATHTGDIDVTIPERDNATVSARAFDGQLRSAMRVNVPAARGRSRVSFVLGNGAARLDAETFRGTISLRPAGGS